MLIGQYNHTIDPKKRLSLPSKWRSELGEKVIITAGLDKSLFVYTINEWNIISEKLANLPLTSVEGRSFTRYMLANAYEVEIDSAGRILIPENLKTLAGLVDKVVLAGMHKRIEIWSEDVWNSVMQAAVADVDNLAGKLGELGVL